MTIMLARAEFLEFIRENKISFNLTVFRYCQQNNWNEIHKINVREWPYKCPFCKDPTLTKKCHVEKYKPKPEKKKENTTEQVNVHEIKNLRNRRSHKRRKKKNQKNRNDKMNQQ